MNRLPKPDRYQVLKGDGKYYVGDFEDPEIPEKVMLIMEDKDPEVIREQVRWLNKKWKAEQNGGPL